MKVFSGQSASTGFASGPALVLKSEKLQLTSKKSEGAATETNLFNQAVQRAKLDLARLKETSIQQNKTESIEILDAHLMLLEDAEAIDQSLQRIQSGESAEQAYFSVIEEFRQMFLQVKDDLIRQRAIDLQDIRERVIFYIHKPHEKFPDLHLEKATIVIAHDLTPSQILSIDKTKLLGFITVEGSGTSHTAILARSLEVPAIVGAAPDVLDIQSNALVLLNAEKGQLFIDVSGDEQKLFLEQKVQYEKKIMLHEAFKNKPSATTDGRQLTMAANISGPQDLVSFKKNDGEAVGLYRTEFLFLDRELAPSEEEQFKIYKDVFQGLNGKPILVRTLDIGGDKQAAYLNMKKEENPFLGIRALRLCFQRPEIFKTQLRALLRAGAGAQWGLMFPMVSQLEELNQAKQIVNEVKVELSAEKKTFSADFQIGIMIEIPSAAWMMPALAPHVDFVSIGTNDLLQYTCAADRLNPELKSIYNPYNVGFLNQIHFVLKTCLEKKVHSGICGSLSHHVDLMPFFVGCGVNELSMSSQHILPTRGEVRKLSYEKCQRLVTQVLACSTTAEVKEKFKEFHG